MSDDPTPSEKSLTVVEQILLRLGKAQADQGEDTQGRVSLLETRLHELTTGIDSANADRTKQIKQLKTLVWVLAGVALSPALQSLGLPTKELIPFAAKLLLGLF